MRRRAVLTAAAPLIAAALLTARPVLAADSARAVEAFLPRALGFWMRTATDTRIADDGIHASATYSPTGERVFRLTITLLTPAAARRVKPPPEMEGLIDPNNPGAPVFLYPEAPGESPQSGVQSYMGGTVLSAGGTVFVATASAFDGTIYWGRPGRRVIVTCDARDPEIAGQALGLLDLRGLAKLGR